MKDSTLNGGHWMRWAFVALLVVTAIGGAWMKLSEPTGTPPLTEIRIGQTIAEVEAIIGREYVMKYDGPDEGTDILVLSPGLDAMSMHIHFDRQGRVDRIKQGSETGAVQKR